MIFQNPLTPTLSEFEILNDTTFIFQNWLVSGHFDMNDYLSNFDWKFVITIFVEIIFDD